MTAPTTFAVAIACGTAGAYVDVSSYLESTEDFNYTWGRQSSFDDTDPSEFSFVLNNADGRFTPDNTSSALATTLTEGMGVCWQLNTRLVAGTIQAIEPQFPGDVAAWSTVRVTCDDMLGTAARHEMQSLPRGLVDAATPYFHWPLDDREGSPFAQARNGATVPPLAPESGTAIVFGGDPFEGVGLDSMELLSGSVGAYASLGLTPVSYTGTSKGFTNFWVTPGDISRNSTNLVAIYRNDARTNQILGIIDGYWAFSAINSAFAVTDVTTASTEKAFEGVPTHFSIGHRRIASDYYTEIYMNGVLVRSGGPLALSIFLNPNDISGFQISAHAETKFSNLSHTLEPVNEYVAISSTEAQRLTAIAASNLQVTLDTPPATLSTQTLGATENDGTMLSAFNDVIRGEQGQIYTATTGTVTAPVQKIKVRARDRPTVVSHTFGVESDTIGTPLLSRDITDLVATVDVRGPSMDVTVTDSTLIARAGNRSVSEEVLFAELVPLREYGNDRLYRGANTKLRISEVVVDARTASTDKWAQLLAMLPGDRVQITGLPSAQLGFSTWDGWFLGASERHNVSGNEFVLYFEPVTAPTGILDTDRFMGGTDLTLSAGITAVAASMSVATAGATFTTTELPVTILVDSEQMTVTACSSATPQVMTVTRGANGTTAAVHSLGAQVELATSTLAAY